jgi:phosphoribosylformylglycinamidine cyclo-ligase
MPGFYADGEYDVAGFIVGVVDRSHIIDGARIVSGDVLIGLPSVGLHTNGYSLARKLFFEVAGYAPATPIGALGCTASEELLKPHRSYLGALEGLLESGLIKGLAHITGGGLLENLARIIPPDRRAVIRRGSWPVPPVFTWLQRAGSVEQSEMDQVFNLGVGLVLVVSPYYADSIRAQLADCGLETWPLGQIVDGPQGAVWE